MMLALTEVLLALVVSLLVEQLLKFRWPSKRLPPGPTPLPIIGNLWSLGFTLNHDTLIEMAKTYGNVYTLWMGPTPIIVLNGCQAVRNALISHSEELSGRPTTPLFDELAKGKGVVFTSGHIWKQQRRFGLMTLRNLGLGKKGLETRIQDEARWLVDGFAIKKGKAMDPSPAIVHSVTNVIAAVVFGHRFSKEDKLFHEMIEATDFLTHFIATKWGRLFDAFPWLMRYLPGPQQKFFKCNAFMNSFVEREIRIHEENGAPEEPQDFIDFYLHQLTTVHFRASQMEPVLPTLPTFSSRKYLMSLCTMSINTGSCKRDVFKRHLGDLNGASAGMKDTGDAMSSFDEKNMIRLVTDLFWAGMETITTTMRWALLYMVAYPDIQEKAQKEIDAVLGDAHIIQYEDRKRMPFTNAVIHEIQRYSNIASIGVMRQVVQATSLQGFPIEKGTIILPNLSSVLYDPEHWETPRQFNPSHFLDKEGNFVTKEAFLPFSAGHRVCLGEQLARIELFIFFTSLLRFFTFQLPEGVKEVNMDYILGGNLQPHPYMICAVPR